MNLERSPKILKRLLTSEHLLAQASGFANVLAAGRWNYPTSQGVQRTDKFIESYGEDYSFDEEFDKVIVNAVTISFSALKRYVDTEKGSVAVSTFTVTSTTSQEITKDEIPSNVMSKILEDAKDPDHLLYIDPEVSEVDASDEIEGYDIRRNQEVVYSINNEGEIDDYILRYYYSLDDESIHKLEHSDSDNQTLWNPIRLDDGSVSERRPFGLADIDEADIDSEAENIDAAFMKLLDLRDTQELDAFSALDEEEHIRRVLGMISIVSGGFVSRPAKGISRLAGWYNNIYDYLLHRWERKP